MKVRGWWRKGCHRKL